MPAGGRRQSVCGGRVVKGSRRCDNLPALTLLQHIWAGGDGEIWGKKGVSGVGGDGGGREVGERVQGGLWE